MSHAMPSSRSRRSAGLVRVSVLFCAGRHNGSGCGHRAVWQLWPNGRRPFAGCLGPQSQHPVGADIVREIEGLWVVAPELLTNAIGQSAPLALEFPRPCATISSVQRRPNPVLPPAGSIGGQYAKKRPRQAHRVGRPWLPQGRIGELLGGDGEYGDAAVQNCLDDRPVRRLNWSGCPAWAQSHSTIAPMPPASRVNARWRGSPALVRQP